MRQKLILFFVGLFSCAFVQAQSIDELKNIQTEKQANVDDLQAQIDAAKAEIADLQTAIDKLSGWRTGFTGLVGFNWNSSNGWIANPNPDATSTALNIGLTGYALADKEKTFWHNKGILTKSWQDVDLSEDDGAAENDGLFDNGTVDILNLSSLAGYKINDKIALSGLAELNTSVENFLSPGTFDIGVGATWLPMDNMTVVIHPLNYQIAFSGLDALDTKGSLGAKVRVDYFKDFVISGKSFSWTTTLTSFLPYSNEKQVVELVPGDPTTEFEAGLFVYTWLNTITFDVWKGVGVGIGFGLRNAEFESSETQSYTSIGLSYNF